MINSLTIKNIKTIKDSSPIEFSKLNVISGTNSSGKSTIIQSILLLSQRNNSDILNGPVISLGDITNIRNIDLQRTDIASIEASFDNHTISLEISDEDIYCTSGKEFEDFSQMKDIAYLSADRIGVKDVYYKNIKSHIFDSQGNFAVDYLYRYGKQIQRESNLFKSLEELSSQDKFGIVLSKFDSRSEKKTLQSLVDYWLAELTGYHVHVNDVPDSNVIQILYSKINDNIGETTYFRPQHVGTGVTFILLQLIISIGAKEDAVIIIENPEIHLHPKIQSKLFLFYTWIASTNRQIILETHSDHIFNSARYYKAKGEEIKIFFLDNNEGFSETTVEEIKVGQYGVVLNDAPDLFNQFESDLDRMMSDTYE